MRQRQRGGQCMKEREKLPDESFAHVGGSDLGHNCRAKRVTMCVCVPVC